MPLIVDKEKERLKILNAFEECLKETPMSSVSLRDIAKKANMSHPKLLNYFENKDDLIISYCDYIKNYMSSHCLNWFKSHSKDNYSDKTGYINAFLEYVCNGDENETRPLATVQTYVLAKYNNKIDDMIKNEFKCWKKVMKDCLQEVYGNEASDNDSEYMMVLISGIFICKYNGVLSGNINSNILSSSKLFSK